MESSPKLGSGEAKTNNSQQQEEHQDNPNLIASATEEGGGGGGDRQAAPRQSSRRTPFANLSQVDADLALARTLQEQVHFFTNFILFYFFCCCYTKDLGFFFF